MSNLALAAIVGYVVVLVPALWCWYDLGSFHRPLWVGYGDRTVDEMAHAWMNVVYLTDAEYQEWLAKKRANTTNDERSEPRQ